jgi:hypothetical protein
MKKLVPKRLSNKSITPPAKSAGNAKSAITDAIKIPQTDRGMRIKVIPLVRHCRTVVT